MTQSMLSDEQIEEIVYIVLNHGQVDDAVAEIREYLTALAPPVAPADDREAVADDVGALIVPETGVPLAEWPEVKALGNGSAIAPPGLLLSLGDGRAVEVTDRLAKILLKYLNMSPDAADFGIRAVRQWASAAADEARHQQAQEARDA